MNGPSTIARHPAARPLGLLAGLWLILAAASGRAEPASIARTWSLFQAAVQANDAAAMARITRFPLESNEFGGAIPDADRLQQRFGQIFTPAMRQCLLHQSLKAQVMEGRTFYEALCDADRYPIRFVFGSVGADVRWTAIDNINE